VLDQKANTTKAEQDAEDARMKAETDAELEKMGVLSDQARKLSIGSSRQLSIRADIEEQRYSNAQKQLEAQLAAEKAKVEQARAIYDLQLKQKNMLKVRAGMNGILQELTLTATHFRKDSRCRRERQSPKSQTRIALRRS
jgi:multidrug resistance efflux pump